MDRKPHLKGKKAPSHAPSVKSRKSTRSIRSHVSRHHPYYDMAPKWKQPSRANPPLTTSDFFSAISTKTELGKDFLREMDTPICTSKTVFLPLDISQISPGKCLILSPFGHTTNLGFHCDRCSGDSQRFSLAPGPSQFKSGPEKKENDLFSVTLTFYNNADKVVQHKTFYLSLLCLSMQTVKMSFMQPGLFYGYMVLKQAFNDILPIFEVNAEKTLTMYLIFKPTNVHIGENYLRLLTDNLSDYIITMDCVKQTYILKFYPLHQEQKILNARENSICEAIAALDCTDELREDIARGLNLILHLPPHSETDYLLKLNLLDP